MATDATPGESAPVIENKRLRGAVKPLVSGNKREREARRVVAGRRARRRRDNLAGHLFLLPWLLGFVLLVAGPMLGSLYLSFTEFNLFDAPEWIGLSNYTQMFTTDQRYLHSLRVTGLYVVLSVPLRLVVALGLAVALNRGLRGLNAYRAIFYLPSLLGGSVAIAILWRQVFGGDGLVNRTLADLGIQAPNWVADPDWSIYTLVLLGVWQFGSPAVIFLAGLRQIPGELTEAATVDGAGRARRFWSITLPLLTPLIFFNLVFQTIVAFQAFTPAFVVSNGTGGPVDSTLFYTLYLYIQGFGEFRMGYASAMAWVLLSIVGTFTAVAFWSSRFWVFYEDSRR
ncbi:MAG: carbohydrate ABC transporter permease [Micromonosporaceae bacterium]